MQQPLALVPGKLSADHKFIGSACVSWLSIVMEDWMSWADGADTSLDVNGGDTW